MINDLGDLDKLLKLCRKRGVIELKLGTVELKLGDLPARKTSDADEPDEIETPHAMTPEQLLFFSADGSV